MKIFLMEQSMRENSMKHEEKYNDILTKNRIMNKNKNKNMF